MLYQMLEVSNQLIFNLRELNELIYANCRQYKLMMANISTIYFYLIWLPTNKVLTQIGIVAFKALIICYNLIVVCSDF